MDATALQGRTAIVTGASAGIGAATARALADAGANVVLAARSKDRLRSLADEIEATHDVEALVVPTDVREEAAVDALIEETAAAFGGIDVLVNNAGLARGSDVVELSTEQYETIQETNVDGVFYATRAALPHLRERGGHLVFLGSFAGQYPRPFNPVYAASKWWVRGFAASVSAQVGDAVGVTVINPSEVRSPTRSSLPPRARDPARARSTSTAGTSSPTPSEPLGVVDPSRLSPFARTVGRRRRRYNFYVRESIYQIMSDSRAVSPVVSTVLLVAIVIILAASVSPFILGLADDVPEPAPNVVDSAATYERGSGGGCGNNIVRLTHNGGDTVRLSDTKTIVRLPDSGGKRATITGFPVSTTTLDPADYTDPDNILTTGSCVGGEAANGGTGGWSAGSSFSFRLNKGDGDIDLGDTIEIRVVHEPSDAIIVRHAIRVQP